MISAGGDICAKKDIFNDMIFQRSHENRIYAVSKEDTSIVVGMSQMTSAMSSLISPNLALESIFKHQGQIMTLNANFLITPDRSRYARRSIDLPLFQRI